MQYKLFGKTGLRVSEICLGTMTFGEEWGTGANKHESKKIFEAFVESGGNFIDTANRYTEGTSEKFVGEFVGKERDAFVIASKYSLYDRRDDINAAGNHRKNLIRSVEGTLKRLNTDYIDLLWLHAWDFTTSPEEVMRGLDDLVRMGKITYVGVSDTPAWIVAQANTLADLRGWTAFAGLQIEYSLIQRTVERDLIPMAKHFGMAITPWAPLGAGMLTGKHNQAAAAGARLTEKSVKMTEKNRNIAIKVSEVAQKLGVTSSQIALNWLRQQHQQIIPIVGSRKAEQIKDSLNCINFEIPPAQMQELTEVSAIDLGFPHDFLESRGVQDVLFADFIGKLQNHKL
jgi:aryl-alcohol dehydrogenase-like predicted oxidoreductase